MSESPHVFATGLAGFERDVVEASRTRPVLVDFWAAWCQPCRMLMPVLERVVDEMQGALLLAKVDTDAEQELAARMGVRSLPTVRLFRDGRAVAEFMGAQPERAVREFLAAHLGSPGDEVREQAAALVANGELDAAERLLHDAWSASPGNDGLAIDLAGVLMGAGRVDDALAVLDALSAASATRDDVRRLRAQADFARRAAAIEDTVALSKRDRAGLDDAGLHDLATLGVAAGRFEEALQLLLALVTRNRAFRDDAARRDMLAVFGILGDTHPLTREYRRRLATALH